jgi:hypothetical protein
MISVLQGELRRRRASSAARAIMGGPDKPGHDGYFVGSGQ